MSFLEILTRRRIQAVSAIGGSAVKLSFGVASSRHFLEREYSDYFCLLSFLFCQDLHTDPNGANLRVISDEIRASWGTSWCADSDVGETCRTEVFMGPHHEFWWRAATH